MGENIVELLSHRLLSNFMKQSAIITSMTGARTGLAYTLTVGLDEAGEPTRDVDYEIAYCINIEKGLTKVITPGEFEGVEVKGDCSGVRIVGGEGREFAKYALNDIRALLSFIHCDAFNIDVEMLLYTMVKNNIVCQRTMVKVRDKGRKALKRILRDSREIVYTPAKVEKRLSKDLDEWVEEMLGNAKAWTGSS